MSRLTVGAQAPDFSAPTVYGGEFKLADYRGRRLFLAFQRYASCPVCNFSLRQFQTRHQELQAKGIAYAPIFHSDVAKLREYYPSEPSYPILSDPGFKLYRLYGLEPSLGAFLHPKAVLDGLKAVKAWATGFKPGFSPDGETTTVPAGFLIGADGKIERLHYGVSLGDSWSVDQVLAFA